MHFYILSLHHRRKKQDPNQASVPHSVGLLDRNFNYSARFLLPPHNSPVLILAPPDAFVG